ncbi:4-coumarate--CoA ligase-like 1 [Aplysia californica]|uniref:4-coumarate--CoA ligase-like 1 n=1 Tax=Aplysia californica TaxID=6500 RepID=A0ABM0ZWD9_APLCA|nr:4-coumarate--CoA ligase-like 1 [Aplysia californica]
MSRIRDHDTLCKRLKFLADNFPDRELFIFYDHGLLLADGSDFFEVAKKARCRAVVADLHDKGPASTLFLPYNRGATSSSKRFVDLNIDSAPELTSAINVFRDGDTLQVVDKDEKECAVGKVGTVRVKGKTVFSGYFNQLEEKDPATTGQFSEDGWFDTNDNGYFDDKGRLYVIGRNNDVITYGDCLVYPGWLEQKILAHPKVRDVCLVPVPHPVLYQDMCACVLAAPDSQLTQDELRQFCAQICFSDGHEEKPLIPTYFMV